MAADAAWLSAHPPPAVVEVLLRAAAACGFGQSCAPATGATLRALAASKPGGRILNLGTGVGISCAWLLDSMSDDAALWTVDVDGDLSAIAGRHLDGRAHLVVEDGAAFLERASAAGERYDLIFADAMPGKYERLDLALGMVAPAGWYVVDDLRPSDDFPEAATWAPSLVDRIASDRRFLVVTLDWATGLMLAVRGDPDRPAMALVEELR